MEKSREKVVVPVLMEQNYTACTIPYRSPPDKSKNTTPTELFWINLFADSIPSFRNRAESDDSVADAPAKAEKFAQRYKEMLEDLKKDPESHGGPPDCILLCQLREQAASPWRGGIRRYIQEGQDAIEDEAKRIENLIRGIFAGNIFDLGSAQLKDENGKLLGVDTSNLFIANSGNDLPVIDLTSASQEVSYLASDADLVILGGMVKHPEVAEFLGGRLYDCIVKFNQYMA